MIFIKSCVWKQDKKSYLELSESFDMSLCYLCNYRALIVIKPGS